MARSAFAVLAGILALAVSAHGAPVTRGGSFVVRDDPSDTHDVRYEWEYVHGADPYVDFDIHIVTTSPDTSSELTGFVLGLVSSSVAADYGSEASFSLMMASRHIHFLFNADDTVSITQVVPEKCAFESGCNNAGYGGGVRTGYRKMLDASTCSVNDRMLVLGSTYQSSGRVYTASISLRIYPDAFQQCSNGNGNAGEFEFSVDPSKSIKLVHGVWVDATRAAPLFSRRKHTYVWSRGDGIELSLTENPPTQSPTDAPTPAPTTPAPTEAPTPPTKAPTNAPTLNLRCPDEEAWIECDRVNEMFKNLRKRPEARKNRIRSMCKSSKFRGKCVYCDSGRDDFTGCRPKRNDRDRRYRTQDVCQGSVDPFEGRCSKLDTCPSPVQMTACRAVNDLPVPGTNRNKRPICLNAFEYDGTRIPKGACHWCRGRCKAIGEYDFPIAKAIICENDDYFKTEHGCEYDTSPATTGIVSDYYNP